MNSQSEYRNFAKSENFPKNVPKAPASVFGNKWKGWTDFLGKKNKFNYNFFSYNDAKKIVSKYKFKEGKDFYKYIKLNKMPAKLPRGPQDRSNQ